MHIRGYYLFRILQGHPHYFIGNKLSITPSECIRKYWTLQVCFSPAERRSRLHYCQSLTTQAMYVESNIEALPCDNCCCGKAISITYFECVFVALGIRHAKRVRHIAICGLSGFTIFCHHVIIYGTIYRTRHVYFDFLYNVCVQHF